MSDVTAKWSIPYIEGTDIGDTIDATDQAKAELLDDLVTPIAFGARGSRPVSTAISPGIAGQRYMSTGDGGIDLDTGTSWVTDKPGLFTSLPTASGTGAGLDEGMEIYLQTAGMATALVPPYHLRYDSTLSGTSKWAVISAMPWIVTLTAGETVAPVFGAFGDFADGGPTIPLPSPGDYAASFGAVLSHTLDNNSISVAPAATGLAATDANSVIVNNPTTANDGAISVSRQIRLNAISGTLKLQYRCANAGGFASVRFVAVTPLRLG